MLLRMLLLILPQLLLILLSLLLLLLAMMLLLGNVTRLPSKCFPLTVNQR